jgi:aspartate-semialdehyde dehydrogenase
MQCNHEASPWDCIQNKKLIFKGVIMSKTKVAILGATGAVGQRFVQLLENHPWFEVGTLTGSERSIGKKYGDVCNWVLAGSPPEYAREMRVVPSDSDFDAQLVFSALPSQHARNLEPALAKRGYAICSNASACRTWEDVPIMIPEVNADHTRLLDVQQKNHNWSGFIVTNPNCTSTGLTIAFRALHDAFRIKRAFIVSMQALSGAGYPGVASLDIIDNAIPYIGGEEEKVEREPLKMLGTFDGEKIDFAPMVLSAHTNRVAVIDGHLVVTSVEFAGEVTPEEAKGALRDFKAPKIVANLPSAPRPVIVVKDEADRPQPRRDRYEGKGMASVVGRLRTDPIFHIKFANLAHNTIRGAAGGAILNGELLKAEGRL